MAEAHIRTGMQGRRWEGSGFGCFCFFLFRGTMLTIEKTLEKGFALQQQLMAISVFLSAANGTRYLAEFVEFGGLLTILDLLSIRDNHIAEEDKFLALKLLSAIAHSGRFYKEVICSFNGVQILVALMELANQQTTR